MFRLFSALILLSITQLSFAETELIDLSGYSTGDIPKYLLGEGLIVDQEVLDRELKKYVTGQNDNGRIEYTIPNLNRNFEIIFEVDPSADTGSVPNRRHDIFIALSANNETNFWFKVSDDSMKLGPSDNDEPRYFNTGWDGNATTNTIKIKVQDGTIKSYINSTFFQSTLLIQPNSVYNQLVISEIGQDDKIYSVTVKNLGSSTDTIPEVPSANYEKGKQAGIEQCIKDPDSCGIKANASVACEGLISTETTEEDGEPNVTITDNCIANYFEEGGELHIPCISVPGAFGKLELYDIWLQQLNNTLSFELDLNRVTAK